MKFTLQKKILMWFIVIIVISFALYGFLTYYVYNFNLRGERYNATVREHFKNMDPAEIERLREMTQPESFGPPPGVTVLPPALFLRIFYTITGGVLIIIIIAASGGFLVLRSMFKRIDFITENVKEIDEKRLNLRLNLKGNDAISKMAKEFDDMLDKIETSFNKQKQFIQNVSHELNTPLTIIKTKIDALRQKRNVTKKEYIETIDLIDSEIMRLSRITEELLTLSDLEENRGRDNFREVNIKVILEKMIKLFKNRIDSKNLKLKTSFEGCFITKGIETQLEQLFFNLIDNAIKYSVPGKELGISLKNSKDKKLIICKITNISEAIGEEDLNYVFDRFYRNSTPDNKKSFGLGLSISKKIIENHDGTIEVSYDKDRKKVTFKVCLPLLLQNKSN
ncbi:MAG: HAMP domain-containing sensor histidine kinase [Actinomycetota bacterium]|jgi:signal transduction histidine kinase|nr:HAMP domain-containing sensor histidine kinase [Actinomycetota bacterium]